MVKTKRIYDPREKTDGYRILVDRLWPRGMTKQKAGIALWLRDIAPSDELRKWFGHDPRKWAEFKQKYRKELEGKSDLVVQLRQAEREKKIVTLLFSARDEKHNNAVALKEIFRLVAHACPERSRRVPLALSRIERSHRRRD